MPSSGRRFPVAYAFSRLLHLLFPVVVVAFASTQANAQLSAQVREGSRLRITTPAVKGATGTVKSITGDSITLFTEGSAATLTVAIRDLNDVQISRGRSGTAGAIRGALWGAGIGGLSAAIIIPLAKSNDAYETTDSEAAAFAIQSILGGVVWGAGIGALVKREVWDEVKVQPTVGVSSRGVRLGFSLDNRWLH